jgi:hypothetical protein
MRTAGYAMSAFIVELPNRRGELAHLAQAIAEGGINITACCGATYREGGSVVLLTDDEAGTRAALEVAGYAARQVELVSVWVSDRPGGLAEAARRLDDAGVNIEALIPTQTLGGNVRVSFATDNPARARTALRDEIVVAGRR